MFKLFTKRDKRTNLEKEIDSVLKEMSSLKKDSEEYADMLDNLKVLYEARGEKPKSGIGADTIAIVCGNLLGIILILTFEKIDIITSKAIGFVLRGRV